MYLVMKQTSLFPLKFNFHNNHLNNRKELLNMCMIMSWVCCLCIFKLPLLTFRIYSHFPTLMFNIY